MKRLLNNRLSAIVTTIVSVSNLAFTRHSNKSKRTLTSIETTSKRHDDSTNSIIDLFTSNIKPTPQKETSERRKVRRKSAIRITLDLIHKTPSIDATHAHGQIASIKPPLLSQVDAIIFTFASVEVKLRL